VYGNTGHVEHDPCARLRGRHADGADFSGDDAAGNSREEREQTEAS
jgi:hypothetical protein